jgi:hypothetical protein
MKATTMAFITRTMAVFHPVVAAASAVMVATVTVAAATAASSLHQSRGDQWPREAMEVVRARILRGCV